METKFYVGQRVRSNKFGEGVVVAILTDADDVYPVECDINGWKYTFTIDGQHNIIEPIDLFYIDPPRVVLTEWQRKRLIQYEIDEQEISIVEDVLSSPEPPKYQPKQGEAVLVKVCKDYPWVTGVFSNMEYDAYKCYGVSPVNFCRPFDASLVGQVTSD